MRDPAKNCQKIRALINNSGMALKEKIAHHTVHVENNSYSMLGKVHVPCRENYRPVPRLQGKSCSGKQLFSLTVIQLPVKSCSGKQLFSCTKIIKWAAPGCTRSKIGRGGVKGTRQTIHIFLSRLRVFFSLIFRVFKFYQRTWHVFLTSNEILCGGNAAKYWRHKNGPSNLEEKSDYEFSPWTGFAQKSGKRGSVICRI